MQRVLLMGHQPWVRSSQRKKQTEEAPSEVKLAHHHLQEFLKPPWVSMGVTRRSQALQHPVHPRARTAKPARTYFVVLAFCLSAVWWAQIWLKDTPFKTWAAIFILLCYKLFIHLYHLPLALVWAHIFFSWFIVSMPIDHDSEIEINEINWIFKYWTQKNFPLL